MVDFTIEVVAGIAELILDLCLENVHWRPKRKRSDKEGEKRGCDVRDGQPRSCGCGKIYGVWLRILNN